MLFESFNPIYAGFRCFFRTNQCGRSCQVDRLCWCVWGLGKVLCMELIVQVSLNPDI